jgi:hypothetical protein
MSDLAYLAVVVIFALLSWGFVVLCDKLMGASR